MSSLFETHLTVSNLSRSVAFYRDVDGLPLAFDEPERGAVFLWVGGRGESMLGLWSLGSAPIGISLHVDFKASLEDVLDAPDRLRGLDVTPLTFFGIETTEPSVIGWMPAAAVYFRDPDGHFLEYTTTRSSNATSRPPSAPTPATAQNGELVGTATCPLRARLGGRRVAIDSGFL